MATVETDTGATQLTINRNHKPSKRLTIDYSFDVPKFTFEGVWEGKDVIITRNLLRREYLRHQQGIRREANAA